MPATATAPARSPRTRQRHAPARLVPVAVGRTAVAVGGIADSGLMVRLTRGRLWIGLLGTLLVGIVGLNVVALSFNARSSETARKAEALAQRNSALRAQIANQLDTEEIQAAATQLGLLSPAPGEIRYLKTGPGDATAAAKRLRDGDLTTVDSVAIATVETVTETADAATTATTDVPVADEAATDPPATDAAATPTPTADSGPSGTAENLGGVVAP